MLRCDHRENNGPPCEVWRFDDVEICPACGSTHAHWEPTRQQIRHACAIIQATWNARTELERRHRYFRPRLAWPVLVGRTPQPLKHPA